MYLDYEMLETIIRKLIALGLSIFAIYLMVSAFDVVLNNLNPNPQYVSTNFFVWWMKLFK